MANTQISPWVRVTLGVALAMHLAVVASLIGGGSMGMPPWMTPILTALVSAEVVVFLLTFFDLVRYWPALLGVIALKWGGVATGIIGPIVGMMAWQPALTTAAFDGAWSVVLLLIIRQVGRLDDQPTPVMPLDQAIEQAVDQHGQSLLDISMKQPVLVVFLRHFGCTFCREALADLSTQRPRIEADETAIALVHMGTDDEAEYMLSQYSLEHVHRVSDPLRRIYRAFALRRGSFGQLFGWKVWIRGLQAGVLKGHGLGKLMGDSFQMPGVFLLSEGKLVHAFRHLSAADRPNYVKLAHHREQPSKHTSVS